MEMFLECLRGRKFATRSRDAQHVVALARGVEDDPGVVAFLQRAAVLHADAAVFADRFPPPLDDEPRIRPQSGRRSDPPPPLLSTDRVVLIRDGRVLGEAVTNWNLPFARSLLDLLRDDRDFVGEWYHAIAAYLFAQGMNGAPAHLERAAQVLPDDARLLFDRGSYAEALGLPIYQAVSADASSQDLAGVHLLVPSESRSNGEAERLYRSALQIDPSFVEARVRLARLLDHRGQHDEAASEIEKALEAKPAGVVGFYAHLVAGRVATARGRYDESLEQYRAASQLYGHAQSALLGASQAALMASDVAGTLAPVTRLRASPATFDADPWWDYQLGAGRDVDALMAHLWARVAVK
jgi:tetratricopeptide (TPR) repeat protein